MYSLFEEQITFESFYVDHYLTQRHQQLRRVAQLLSRDGSIQRLARRILNLIRRAKEAVDIPIIGSLNGVSAGGWIDYAGLIEDAGADALELNVYYIPTNLESDRPAKSKTSISKSCAA